jgi:hypothetical protein
MKFSPFLLRQGCGGQAGSIDSVSFFTALRLNGGVAALIFSLAVIYYFAEGDYTMAESKLRLILFSALLAVAGSVGYTTEFYFSLI